MIGVVNEKLQNYKNITVFSRSIYDVHEKACLILHKQKHCTNHFIAKLDI